MWPDKAVVETQPGEDRRVVFLKAVGDLLALPQCVTVEGLHLVVVHGARHVDVPLMRGLLVKEIRGLVLLVGAPEVECHI